MGTRVPATRARRSQRHPSSTRHLARRGPTNGWSRASGSSSVSTVCCVMPVSRPTSARAPSSSACVAQRPVQTLIQVVAWFHRAFCHDSSGVYGLGARISGMTQGPFCSIERFNVVSDRAGDADSRRPGKSRGDSADLVQDGRALEARAHRQGRDLRRSAPVLHELVVAELAQTDVPHPCERGRALGRSGAARAERRDKEWRSPADFSGADDRSAVAEVVVTLNPRARKLGADYPIFGAEWCHGKALERRAGSASDSALSEPGGQAMISVSTPGCVASQAPRAGSNLELGLRLRWERQGGAPVPCRYWPRC